MAAENGRPVPSNQVGVVVEPEIAVIAVAEPFPIKRFLVEGLVVIGMGKFPGF